MSKYYFFKYGPGPCMMGTDVCDCEGMTEEEIETMAYELAIEQACRFGDFVMEDDPCLDECDGDSQYFTDSDLSYSWALYCPEKHDMFRAGGGSFKDDSKD